MGASVSGVILHRDVHQLLLFSFGCTMNVNIDWAFVLARRERHALLTCTFFQNMQAINLLFPSSSARVIAISFSPRIARYQKSEARTAVYQRKVFSYFIAN